MFFKNMERCFVVIRITTFLIENDYHKVVNDNGGVMNIDK